MFLVAGVVILLDIVMYRRLVRSGVRPLLTRLFAVAVVLLNSLLWVGPALMFIPFGLTAQILAMRIVSGMLTLYILATLPRLVFYLFLLIGKSRVWRWIGAGLSVAVLSLLLYGVVVTRTDYNVKRVTLRFDNLPKGFRGYRIAFISDLHIGSMYDAEEELEALSKVVEGCSADLLIFGGDLVNLSYEELSPDIIERLSSLRGREGTVAVLGNHDTGTYIRDSLSVSRSENIEHVCGAMSSAGWRLLRDETLYIRRGCDSIAVTGIDFTDSLLQYKHSFDTPQDFDPAPIYRDVPSEVFNITVAHLPQLWHPICDGGYSDLTLSGHVHATQMKVGCKDVQLSPAMLMYRQWSGEYRAERGSLYVTDGIGYVGFYGRFGTARPEISLLQLDR